MANDNLNINGNTIGTDSRDEDNKTVHVQRVRIDGTPSVSLTPLGSSDTYDAFGRLRISNPRTLLDAKVLSDAQPLIWDDQETSGSGTTSAHNANQASVSIGVAGATAGKRTRQTKSRAQYQPGKSQLAFITGVIGASAAGLDCRVGIFDDDNGLFFEMDPTGIGVVVRTKTSGSPVSTRIVQSSWNIDTMDGNGDSEITIDFMKTQIFVIDFEWLGVGDVRFGVVVGGVLYYVHKVNNSNVLSLVYMSNPNLPIRYEIENDGGGVAATLTCICSTVISEGGRQETGTIRCADRGATALAVNANTTIFALFAMRLNDVLAKVIPTHIEVFNTANDPFIWRVILNPTLAVGSLSFSAESNSSVDIAKPDNTVQYTAGTGTVLAAGYADADVVRDINLGDFDLGSNIDGTSDIVVLAIERLSGAGSESIYGTISWRESL